LKRPARPFARLSSATLVLTVALVAGCSSTSAPAGSSPSATAGPASAAPVGSPSTAPSSASPASPPAAASPTPVASTNASPAAGSAAGAQPQPAGDPCAWLDKATIDATLGLSVGTAIPNVGDAKGRICTWLSKTPVGGTTLAIISPAEVGAVVAGYQKLPGGQLVPGLGVKAAALFLAKAPLPPHAQVFVDFGGWGLSVDASGPAITVDAAAQLAAAVVAK